MSITMIRGRCTTAVFKIPNVIRGLAGSSDGGISLPFSATTTQAILAFVFLLMGIPAYLISNWLFPFVPAIARFLILIIIVPLALGYKLGMQQRESMSMIRYWIIKWKTKYEPNEMIRFEEVEQDKEIRFEQKIRMKRHFKYPKEVKNIEIRE
ncbi:TPA: hypothetical protein L4613_006192 [Pseudomonas aeruginosa]|nr:hypothetical protein [Pseudomonas aeruginosa]